MKRILLPILLFPLSQGFFAAETITVTASKIPIPLEKTTNSTKVFERDDIQKKAAMTLPQFLQSVSGLAVTANSLFIRGQNSQSVLLIIDGVRYNDPSQIGKNAALDSIDLTQIERIEILKDSQSVLYGSEAVAGVIKITTKSNSKKHSLDLTAEGGDHRFYRASAGTTVPYKNAKFYLRSTLKGEEAMSQASADGADLDPTRHFNLSGGTDWKITPDLAFSAQYSYMHHRDQIDDGAAQDDPNRRLRNITQSFAGDLSYSYFDGMAESKLHTEKAYFTRQDNDDNYPAQFNGENTAVELQNNLYINEQNTLALGIEWQKEEDHSSSNTLSRSKQTADSIYLLHQYNGDRFFSTSGVRYDRHETYGNQLNGKLAPGILFNNGNDKLFASIATNFKAPSLYQLYESQWGAGNDQLRAEKGYTAETGVSHKWNEHGESQLTAFYNRLRQSIIYGPSYRYENGGEQLSKGIEWEESWKFGSLATSGNYTFTATRDGERKNQLRRPKHMGNIMAQYYYRDHSWAGVEYLYKGKREDYNTPTTRHILGGYSIFNMSGEVGLKTDWKLQWRLTNLLDKKYEEIYGYATEGRGFSLALNYHY